MSTFRIHSVRLIREDGEQRWRIGSGVTVVVGPVGVGKTSLLELIKYGLGGDGVLSQAVEEVAVHISIDLELQSGRYELTRSTPSGKTVSISIGDERVRTLPVRGRTDRQTISDWLLDNAGIPRVRLRTGPRRDPRYARVGFPDVFRYMYLDQSEIDRSTIRHLDRVLDGNRRRAFEVLYGLTGPEIAELEAEADQLAERAEAHRAQMGIIESFLSGTDPGGSLAQVHAHVRQVDGGLAAAQQQLTTLRTSAREASGAISGLREELAHIELRMDQAHRQRAERQVQLQRLHLARAGAVADHERAVLAASATEVFAALPYAQCPRCLQAISSADRRGRCVVCGQAEPEAVTTQAVDAERARLEQQILETDHLIHHAERAAQDADRIVEELMVAAIALRARMDEEAQVTVAPFVEEISVLTAEIARLQERRDGLKERVARYERLEALRDEGTRFAEHRATKDAQLASARATREEARHRVRDFSANFTETLERFQPPWYEHSHIDVENYLPVVNGRGLEGNSAGVKTLINDAYYLANLMTALQQSAQIHLPGFLIIDSPRKNFGSGPQDRAAGDRIYSTIDALRAANEGRVQLIIADNDLPQKWRRQFKVITLNYENPLVDRVAHPGKDNVVPIAAAKR